MPGAHGLLDCNTSFWFNKHIACFVHGYLCTFSLWICNTAALMRSADTINCSQPTAESLLQALRESVFDKTEVRPVINPRTPTMIQLDFILYAVLDVVSKYPYIPITVCNHITYANCYIGIVDVFPFRMKKPKSWMRLSGCSL